MITIHGRILSALSPIPRLRPRMPRLGNGMSGIIMAIVLVNVYIPVSHVVEGFHIRKNMIGGFKH